MKPHLLIVPAMVVVHACYVVAFTVITVENLQRSTATRSRKSSQLEAQSRRDVLIAGGGMMASQLLYMPKAGALDIVPQSASLPNGLLDSRVEGNVLAPPPYGMEGPDIFYPE